MKINIQESEIKPLLDDAQREKELIENRYQFLLSEQPAMWIVEPQRLTTTILGGCVASLLPIYMDYKNTFQDFETLGFLLVTSFLLGCIVTHIVGQFIYQRNQKFALVQNIEILKNWKRPIIILPLDRFDPSVDARVKEIIEILDDEKCKNVLHIALENAQMSFEYSIQYGFRTGEKSQTKTGLPVVGLFPELFVLRGAFDAQIWFEFQKEAVRIALEIDSEFAKQWFAIESETYRAVAGGQLLP